MQKVKVVITDYIEPDLQWESEQFAAMGVDFAYYQLKFSSPQQLIEATAEADILIVNMARFDAEVISRLPRCRLIIRHGIGYDNVDVQAATRAGIVVANNPDYCYHEVAEQAIMLILACQRKLLLQNRTLYRSADSGSLDFTSVTPIYSLRGKTLGILGLGRIGGTVFEMVKSFGMQVLVCDPYLSDARKARYGIATYPLEKLLRESDVLTVHTPLTPETYHMLDEPQFCLMKPTAVLINTARGGIVNLRALDVALREGRLAHAGIDVFEEREPPDPDFPLLHNDQAICTPHLSWLSEEAGWSIREKIVDDVRRFTQGQGPKYPLNVIEPVVES